MKADLLLIGGGGHCKAVIDVIEQENKYTIAGIVDRQELLGEKVLGYEVIGSDKDLPFLFQHFKYALITVGQIQSPALRMKLFTQLMATGFETPTIVSPRAYVSKHAKVGKGTVIMHDALINTNAMIGDNCIINSKALVEHDAIVADHCHISTGAILNGGVILHQGSFFGSGAVSKQAIVIAENSFIKAGSLAK